MAAMELRSPALRIIALSLLVFFLTHANAGLILSKVDRKGSYTNGIMLASDNANKLRYWKGGDGRYGHVDALWVVDLSSHNIRAITSMKVENGGSTPVSEVLFALSSNQANSLAFIGASTSEGKGKNKASAINLSIKLAESEITSEDVILFSIVLNKALKPGESVSIEVYTVFTHVLKPFPAEISQADAQLVLYYDSAYVLSPYPIKVQATLLKLPSTRVESYTKVDPVKLGNTELRYGPYEDIPAFSSVPVTVHYENNRPFAVVEELEREIEISNWGNIYVTENYHVMHGGALHKGGFSRLDYQVRPAMSGVAALRQLLARLPPRAHSVYYRDEIGNVSTSHLRSDKDKTELEFEPRYPLFGGWHVTFTIGYGVPLQDFVFRAPDGRRYLKFPFGCPLHDVVVKNLVVKVVLPEGSKEPFAQVPFGVQQSHEVKYSYLDSVGRTVVVLSKKNVVQEHNVFFEVYFKFNTIAMLVEPLMLVTGFFLFFVACIAYARFDFSISKSSASYQARIQREELMDALQRLQNVLNLRRVNVSEKLEASLRDLARTGEIQSCKAARKAADATLKDTTKDLKAIHDSLQSSPRSLNILPKVEMLIAKEKEKQEKLLQKHSVVVESYERKLSIKEIDNRIAPHQQRISVLKQEIDEMLQSLDDF